MFSRLLIVIGVIYGCTESAYADRLIDAFGVKFGCSIDDVVDSSFLNVSDENELLRHELNGCKFLNQRSCQEFEVTDLYSKKGSKIIEGFVATRRFSTAKEVVAARDKFLQAFPELQTTGKQGEITFYSYVNEKNDQRIAFWSTRRKGIDYCLSLVVYSVNLVRKEDRRKREQYNNACVTIAMTTGIAGSGVLIDMNNDLYLYTNRHVIEGGGDLVAKLRTGEQLFLGNLELSKSLDLARFKVMSSAQGMKIDDVISQIGDRITVLGNSLGAGAITQIEGRVLGVGADIVEIDAEFVKGNSGGPIVNCSGKVIGIATYATKLPDKVDWLSKGTRFEKVRRFGVRPFVDDWTVVSLNLLNKQHRRLIDLSVAVALLTITDFVIGDEYPEKKLEVDFLRLNNSGLDVDVLRSYKQLVGLYNAMQGHLQKRNGVEREVVRSLSGYGNISLPCRTAKHGEKRCVLYKIDDGFVGVVKSFCKDHDLKTNVSQNKWRVALSREQKALEVAHIEYQREMDEWIQNLNSKLSRSFEVQAYNTESKTLIGRLERFKELARDNKYK